VLYLQFPDFTIWYYFSLSFIVVACSEEGSKYVMLRCYAYRNKAFNEPFDGIIYSVMIGMGFATLENIGYVLNYGFKTGLIRMFLSVPSHGAFAVLMGYHVGLAKFDQPRAVRHIVKGILLAVFFHGSFDFFLLLQNSPQVKQYISGSLLVGGALVAWYVAIRMSVKSIKLHEELSRQQYLNHKAFTEV
jgi:RsiW-degrading membrane proteinase PrsW (M82 family)